MPLSYSADDVFRDFTTDGVPLSGNWKPQKSKIRRLFTERDGFINAYLANGGLIYDTLASINADLLHGVNSQAWVIADSTVANNGIYRKSGASGAGSWSRVADLPYSFIKMTDAGAGSANAIVATSSLPLPSAPSAAILVSNVYRANTGNVTLAINGAAAKPLLTSAGNQIVSGGLTAGMYIAFLDTGSAFRLLSDQVSSAIQAAAEAAAASAAASLASLGAVITGDVQVKTADYTIVTGDVGDTLVLNSATTKTFTLPLAATVGVPWQVRIFNLGVGNLVVQRAGSDTINGATSVTFQQYQGAVLLSNGSSIWYSDASAAVISDRQVTPAKLSDESRIAMLVNAIRGAEATTPGVALQGRAFVDLLCSTATINTGASSGYKFKRGGIEPAAVSNAAANVLTYPQEFDNAAWTKTRASITANAIAAPDGSLTADKLVEDNTASNTHSILQNYTFTAVPHVFSVYAKADTRSWLLLQTYNGTTTFSSYFNLATGAIGGVIGGGAYTAAIENVGSGWYRCSIAFTPGAGAGYALFCPATGDGGAAYSGNGSSGLYLWGAQLEAASAISAYVSRGDAAYGATSGNNAGWTGSTIAIQIADDGIDNVAENCTHVRVTFRAGTGGSLTIGAAFIGVHLSSSLGEFDPAYPRVPLYFGGLPSSGSISAGATKQTDICEYSIPVGKSLYVAYYVSAGGFVATKTQTYWQTYSKTANEPAKYAKAGYSNTTTILGVERLEYFKLAYSNMTLVSGQLPLSQSPTKVDVVLFLDCNSSYVNDLLFQVSRDGATWKTVALAALYNVNNKLGRVAYQVDLSTGAGTGNALYWRAITSNNRRIKIAAIGLLQDDGVFTDVPSVDMRESDMLVTRHQAATALAYNAGNPLYGRLWGFTQDWDVNGPTRFRIRFHAQMLHTGSPSTGVPVAWTLAMTATYAASLGALGAKSYVLTDTTPYTGNDSLKWIDFTSGNITNIDEHYKEGMLNFEYDVEDPGAYRFEIWGYSATSADSPLQPGRISLNWEEASGASAREIRYNRLAITGQPLR